MNPHIAEDTPIEAMLAAARDAGAYGGKVCGAGGGGYLLLAAPLERHGAIRTELEAARRPVRAVRLHAGRRPSSTRRRHVGATRVTRRFALVDRDGTINEERHHLRDPEQLALIPGAADAFDPPPRGARDGHRGPHQPGRGRAGQPRDRGPRADPRAPARRSWRPPGRASTRSRSVPTGPKTAARVASRRPAWRWPRPSGSGSTFATAS